MKNCKNVRGINLWEAQQLREHLSKHKYYLGEKGIYLDGVELECDFFRSQIQQIAKDLRIEYCSNICEHREDCELAQLFLKKDLDT